MKNKLSKIIKNIHKKKNTSKIATFTLVEVIVIILITSLVVGVATSVIVYKNYNDIKSVGTSSKNDSLIELEDVYNNILNSYVEKVDENELANAAIGGMYNYLKDPYTTYLDESTTNDLMDRLNGEYYGLGIEFTKGIDGFEVVNVFDGSPALKADIKSGDILLSVNNVDLSEMEADNVANMIKNSSNKNIIITIKRGEEVINKDVELSTVTIPSVTSKVYDKTGYINISTFSNTTYSQFVKELEKLEKDGTTSLIIDVRNNGGGYLNAAVQIAELFIEKGKAVYGLKYQNNTEYFYDETKTSKKMNVAILINGASASASEILAAALKDSYNAVLVGTKTYGKGTVQETSELKTGGMVKYTTAYWLTPKGVNINGVGLNPDIEVDVNDTPEDEALIKALDAVK